MEILRCIFGLVISVLGVGFVLTGSIGMFAYVLRGQFAETVLFLAALLIGLLMILTAKPV
ncbi:hypothetical protein [Rubellicoccus peritrichatus]|uniref:Uncharacterized protein n=1 Tax=Rubellicoccus peritrichatus TaxID=3080537 RepID=A0AAQ3L6L9_9BACT|nr:hypothetical protein [Puniceicoccus sp. CR14]WOO40401.1 hypothetical protein RZN69_17415 [Puniceicoccus sp. CR14]WOO40450.1 hypothetical protein RZN69_17660 [Puniceicoccus sp. CR14]WOO40499.1 hypothetical protein RZN69_17905 [Puniceicoccus sp. CR14]WOO40549.1 hypothetical protein RZN69_18155 [Puniceicoccus sp. CR14]